MTTQSSDEELVRPRGTSGSKVAVVAVIAVGAIILACILGLTATAIIFIYNAPW